MPGFLDPELPSIFVHQALLAPDERWKEGDWSENQFNRQLELKATFAAFGERIGRGVGVDAKPPYVAWHIRDDPTGAIRIGRTKRSAKSGELARKRTIVLVKRVDSFASGRGSFNPARPTYLALFEALIGVPATPVFGAAGRLGLVTMTRFRRDVQSDKRDSTTNALITELGFEFELVYENN